MPYTTTKSTWVAGEVVTHDDFNRVEANAEAGVKHNYSIDSGTGLSDVLSATVLTDLPGASLTITSKSGRVLLQAVVHVENTTANARNLSLTLARGGVSIGPTVQVSAPVTTTGHLTIPLCWIDASPGAGPTTYTLRYLINAGNNTLRNFVLIASDI